MRCTSFTNKFETHFRSVADVAVLYVQKLAMPTLRTGRKCRRLLRVSNIVL